eukprot:CAMPEP_0201541428 /NCGR_PEP_ID=MMETSP0161_2-20130828/71474_1 /ASSEMBLY_ACC=CAM_ASM_000251 /TAXON_ID=180227 /ORGANISM="Neoparamoeba aestuarina, Strain SoJaBio B1-5/56/2" /LENGTH=60 /DNA_ID=CAMNT_0047948969 /DNA_START=2361 /DNA_END=2543 /DNA_ORIENTATION=+
MDKTDAVFVENPVKTIDQLDQTKYKAEKWKPYIYTPFYPRKGDDTVTGETLVLCFTNKAY